MSISKIEFRGVWKNYESVTALRDVTYSIEPNEFFVLFGPSGAGKTTTLKIIAGIEFLSQGDLYLNGKLSNFVKPQERNVRMAFENYSLYPHMTVFDNLASPLGARKLSRKEIRNKVETIAKTLDIGSYLERLPRELSGGQKQRVALGRALIVESDLFLLDEPLAHLDAKIRNELRAEFQNIKSILSNSTVVYVTHDYMEAMALGDRMCVIQNGKIVQIDEPKKVYNQPRNTFVAELLGHPTINLIEGELKRKNDGIHLVRDGFSVKIPNALVPTLRSYKKDTVILGFRPKDVLYELKKPKKPGDSQKATIRAYEIRNYKGVILAEVDQIAVTIQCSGYEKVEEGRDIWLRPNAAKMYLFDAETRENLVKHST